MSILKLWDVWFSAFVGFSKCRLQKNLIRKYEMSVVCTFVFVFFWRIARRSSLTIKRRVIKISINYEFITKWFPTKCHLSVYEWAMNNNFTDKHITRMKFFKITSHHSHLSSKPNQKIRELYLQNDLRKNDGSLW